MLNSDVPLWYEITGREALRKALELLRERGFMYFQATHGEQDHWVSGTVSHEYLLTWAATAPVPVRLGLYKSPRREFPGRPCFTIELFGTEVPVVAGGMAQLRGMLADLSRNEE